MAKIIALSPIFERVPARNKKYKEVAVFVHHYGGNRHSFKRHMNWLNELGFDCVTFDLPLHSLNEIKRRLPIGKDWSIGLRHVWADKIEQVLGSLTEDKFVFSFSSTSAAALTAIERRHAIDVKAWICDGGPFADLSLGIDNLIRSQGLFKFKSRLLEYSFIRTPFSKICALALGLYKYDIDSQKSLLALPKGFPVISVRGGQDHLVRGDMIDNMFLTAFNHIDLQRVILHSAGHLTGLKDEPENYKYVIGNFLKL
ncbi:MAG: hypothetical protein KDD38_01615, partial [Bdellovibrionales bacterium]|nr:hypothetical protein [Bdellovibrionales bacterium]